MCKKKLRIADCEMRNLGKCGMRIAEFEDWIIAELADDGIYFESV